jgi:GTP cyclohydrolase I
MMQTIHRTTIVGKCPHGCPDLYAAEFHVEDRVIMVEDIQAAIDDLTREPVYQEALTQALADRLSCVVETRGVHGRFLTECRAEPKEA